MRNYIVFQFQHKVLTHYQPKNTFRTESQLCRNEEFRYKRSQNHPTSSYFVLGGIMSFFGLDEESKRERQYDKEVENNKEEDFDDKLKNILRPAIINIQVNISQICNRGGISRLLSLCIYYHIGIDF